MADQDVKETMNRSTDAEDRGRNCISAVTHDLILCTKDRPGDVAQCLVQVLSSSAMPQNLIVVDSSRDERTSVVVDGLKKDYTRVGCAVVYVRSRPGLPAQRNIGLDLAISDVAHFIDDDSLVEPDYFSEILKIFENLGAAVAGVGGIQSNIVTLRAPFFRRFFLLSAAPGQVTKAACNSLISSKATDSTSVAWLSGCAMSYWTELARHERFDEALEGYALGEDLEFSSRMAGNGLLMVQPSAKIVHKRSEDNRLNVRRFTHDNVVNRWKFVRKHDPRFSRVAFAWSIVGMVCIGLVKTSRGRLDDSISELRGIRDGLLEVSPFSFRRQ